MPGLLDRSLARYGSITQHHFYRITSQITNIKHMNIETTHKTMQTRCSTWRPELLSHQNAALNCGTHQFRDHQAQSAYSIQEFENKA